MPLKKKALKESLLGTRQIPTFLMNSQDSHVGNGLGSCRVVGFQKLLTLGMFPVTSSKPAVRNEANFNTSLSVPSSKLSQKSIVLGKDISYLSSGISFIVSYSQINNSKIPVLRMEIREPGIMQGQ